MLYKTQDMRPIRELIACQKSGWSLEQRFYTDPEIYKLEIEQIVMRNWIFAGHQSELPTHGDFKVFNVAKESAIIVRGEHGEINAFANVCRHRGSAVCLEQSGNQRRFECPYHAWVYGTDGSLIGARDMPADFDKKQFGLHSVSVTVLGGLIFVCFSDDPPSLDHARRDLKQPMEMFDFDNLKIAETRTYPISANWKLSIENYQECYHCAPAHAEYAKMHTLMLDKKKRQRMQEEMRERMPSCGLKEMEFDFADTEAPRGQQGYAYSRTAMFEGYVTGSRNGEPVAPLLGELSDYDGGASDFTLGPMSFFLAYSDHVVGYVFTPVEHDKCQCTIYWMVRASAEEGRDYELDELVWLWDITTYADKEIIVNNWKGVQSRYYRPGPFSGMENMEQRWVDWILQELRKAPAVVR